MLNLFLLNYFDIKYSDTCGCTSIPSGWQHRLYSSPGIRWHVEVVLIYISSLCWLLTYSKKKERLWFQFWYEIHISEIMTSHDTWRHISTSDTGTFTGSKWTNSVFSVFLFGWRKSNTWDWTGEAGNIIFFISPNRENSETWMITCVLVTLSGCKISTLSPMKCATARQSLFSSVKDI